MLVLYNTQRPPSIIYRQDGMTQGDPLSMYFYGLGMLPLIRKLRAHMEEHRFKCIQAWYADDSAAQAKLPALAAWLSFLIEHGPTYGYKVELRKTSLVVEHKFAKAAHRLFDTWGVQISAGEGYLGGFVSLSGSCEQHNYLAAKIGNWVKAVHLLTEVAKQAPQAAYVVMTKCLYPQWEYTQRVISYPNSSDHFFDDLEEAIATQFIPALFGGPYEASPLGTPERQMMGLRRAMYGLPLQHGGLALPPPGAYSRPRFAASQEATSHLVAALSDSSVDYSSTLNREQVKAAARHLRAECLTGYQRIYKTILGHEHMPADVVRAFKRAREYKTHGFLSVQPATGHNFDLSRREFHDGLAIRYRTPVVDLPATCDGCGALMSLSHGLHCHKGGLPTRRHNEICDFLAGVSQQAWGGICLREPVIRQASGEREEGMLKGDFVIKGVWERELVTYFDTRVIDTDAASYLSVPVADALLRAEKEKVRKYADACRAIRTSFTPFVISTDGALAPQASHFVRHLASRLAVKWQKPLSTVLSWLRPRLSCALVRACSYCIRGPRARLLTRPAETARVDLVEDGVAMVAAISFVST
jgi:hypothetical protein